MKNWRTLILWVVKLIAAIHHATDYYFLSFPRILSSLHLHHAWYGTGGRIAIGIGELIVHCLSCIHAHRGWERLLRQV
jgi:hypothetical protein